MAAIAASLIHTTPSGTTVERASMVTTRPRNAQLGLVAGSIGAGAGGIPVNPNRASRGSPGKSSLPGVALAPVAGELAVRVELRGHREHVDAPVLVRGAPDSVRRELGGRTAPPRP